jgi:hypothetical protein
MATTQTAMAEEAASTKRAVLTAFPHLPSFFTQDSSVLHKLHTIMVDRAQHVDKQARAEANAAFHALSSLDTSLGRVLEEEGLLFDGASVSGRALLAKFAQD